MALTNRDLFYLVARASCFCLGFMSYFLMASVPIYNLHWAFMSIAVVSPLPSLWNFTWFIIQVGAICLGLEQLNTTNFYLVLIEWLLTGFTTAPAWAALGVIVYYDFDTQLCVSSLSLSQMCSTIELSVGLYLISGTINLVIALVKSWEFAQLLVPIIDH